MRNSRASNNYVVDTEATHPTPFNGKMTEIGVVHLETLSGFYGHLWDFTPHPDIPALPVVADDATPNYYWFTTGDSGCEPVVVDTLEDLADALRTWLRSLGAPYVFVSDNPGFDFMWIADMFARASTDNPFGHSSRRIGDLAAGLDRNWRKTTAWKRLRTVKHTHNPLDDAMGNAGALRALLEQHGQHTFTD